MSLNNGQMKILQTVCDERTISHDMPEATDLSRAIGLSIDTILYYIEGLHKEGYLKCTTWPDGVSPYPRYRCKLTHKGQVALENPDLLLPQIKEGRVISVTNINNNLQGSNIANFANQLRDSASQNASQFSQSIGQHADDIARLIAALREQAQQFPSDHRDNALIDLDDLQQDLSTSEKREPNRIKRRIISLLAIAGILGNTIATATDFANNIFELADKVGIPKPELLQHIPNPLLPPPYQL